MLGDTLDIAGFGAVPENSAVPAYNPYEVLAGRHQRTINSPEAQKSKTALLKRLDGDLETDWNQIMAELSDTDNVTLAHRDDGHVQIFWTVVTDD